MNAFTHKRIYAFTHLRIKLLGVLILAFCLWLVFILTGRVLRQIALAQIAELTNTKITTKSVDFNLNGSVFIEELVIRPLLLAGRGRPDQEQKYDDVILKAERVYARFGIGSLLLLRPRLKKISVKDFVFNVQQDLDTGRWNIAALKIKGAGGGSGKIPVIRLKRGTLQYSKVSKGQTKVAAEVPLDARFEPAATMQDSYRFSITTAERAGSGKSTLTGFWQPGKIKIEGGISSAETGAFETVWTISALEAELNYDQSNTYSLRLKIKDLLNKQGVGGDTIAFDSRAFFGKSGLFTALQRFFNRYRPWGQVGIDLETSGNLDRLSESKLVGKVYCKDVSICDRKFPYAIEHLIGQIDFTEKSISINNLCGRHKDVKLAVNGWFKNFGPDSKSEIQITSDNMALDDDLYNALNTRKKKLWSDFSPSGLAAIDYRISRKSQTDKKRILAVELLGADALYKNFPYPLKNLTGALLFDHNSITVSDLVSKSGKSKIILNGRVTACDTSRPVYNVSIDVNGIPLDSALEAALPAKYRSLYSQFDIAGLGDGRIKVYTQKQDSNSAGFIADLNFKKTSLKAKKFPLAVSDISAKAVFTPDLIRFKSFKGRYSQGSISLTGEILPSTEAEQLRYRVTLSGKNCQLNDDMLSLLPTPLEKIVSKLQPKGKINYSADLDKTNGGDYPDYRITVDCLGDSVNFELFPYPLKDVRGSLTITKDNITLENITATAADNVQITPNASTIKINGQIAMADDAFSSGRFALCANDIFFDERLGIALPEGVQPFYRKLSPTGRFDLDLENIKIFNAETSPIKGPKGKVSNEASGKYIDFTGTVRFKACNFNFSPAITELNAELEIKGLYKTGEGLCNGQVELIADGLKIKGKSLTELKADVYYDGDQQNWLTRNLIADCYGGRLAGKFELKQPDEAALEYLLQVGFDNIDLKQFLWEHERNEMRLAALSDAKPKETNHNSLTSGKMSGSLSVSAAVGDSSSRVGRCRLVITDMQIGKLSPLAKLLGVLKLTEPKDFAFDRMLVDSYIKHDKLFFEQLDLSGESLAFTGSGWMDLQSQNVDLILTARGHRLATAEPSILESLTEGLGGAVVRMDVTGNVYDPQVTVETLPVIKETLEILGTKPTTRK